MVAPETNGGNATRGANNVETGARNVNSAATIASLLSELKELCSQWWSCLMFVMSSDITGIGSATVCSVLGINYAGRVKECGIKEGQEVTSAALRDLSNAVIALKSIKVSRFKEANGNSKKLIGLWKNSFRALSKGVDLNQLYAVADASSASGIKSEKYLSTTWLAQVKAEIARFESAADTEVMNKYKARKKKLLDLLKLSHLSHIDVNFDPSMPVVPKMDKSELESIKKKIKEVKPKVLKRKELVFRVEQLRTATDEGQSTTSIQELVDRANEAVQRLSVSSVEVVKYEGHDAFVFIKNLWSLACSLHEDLEEPHLEEPHLEEPQENAEVPRRKTRSDVRMQNAAQARKPVCVCNTQINETESIDDWMAKDRKRISYLAFNVMDLQSSKDCYTTCFGMTLLDEIQHNDKTTVVLGYGPDKTSLQLIYKNEEDWASNFSTGYGFGHISLKIADVKKTAKIVEVSPCCEVVQKPCRLQGGSTIICFALDTNGILFELIQNKKKYDPVCRLLLYADNLDRSIDFYRKALGMRVIKRKEDPTYMMVCLGFEDEDKGTVLELRTSNDAKHEDHGDVYYQMIIETEDVLKSCKVLKEVVELVGGAVLEEPSAEKKICSFMDPNGWRLVLVDKSVPDKMRIL